jgi:hypothetical protein
MDAKGALKAGLEHADGIVSLYLSDLTDADLLTRPTPGANHVAWQLGHLVLEEHELVTAICPNAMPPLPAGFEARYSNEKASSDNPDDFLPKADVLAIWKQQRAGALKALESLSDADLDKPAPDAFAGFLRNWGEVFVMLNIHTLMHAGQWAVVRRKLDRKPLF